MGLSRAPAVRVRPVVPRLARHREVVREEAGTPRVVIALGEGRDDGRAVVGLQGRVAGLSIGGVTAVAMQKHSSLRQQPPLLTVSK